MTQIQLLDEIICLDDSPGQFSKKKILKAGKTYRVLYIHQKGVIVNDGSLGYWNIKRFKKKEKTYGEKISDRILTEIKIEELLTKKLSAQ